MSNEKPVAAVAVVIIENDAVLLVKHGEQAKHLTGSYGFPAGRMEPGEQKVETAVRELSEEAGLITTVEDLIPLPTIRYSTFERKDGPTAFELTSFLCTKYSGSLRASEETTPEWVKIADLTRYHLIADVAAIVGEAVSLLEKQDPRQPR
jgi:8-oxo-dGTP diphosphatase